VTQGPKVWKIKISKEVIRRCKSERDRCLLITPFGILIFQTVGPCIICPALSYTFSLLLWYLQIFGPCITCPSLIYSFWLPFWYLQTCVPCITKFEDTKRVIRRRKSERDRWYKGHKFEDTKRIIRRRHLSLSDLHLLITPFGILIFQTFGPCITCPSLIYTFSLPCL
jgi:hypothetical protein